MRLLEHSLAVAYAAETLSSHLLLGDPEKAFTASIIHDIGKVILLTRADQYRQAIDLAGALNIDISVIEKEIFGIDHQEIGYVMSQKWRFPEQFLDVIRNHHAKPEGKEWLLDVVRIADTFIANPATDLGESSIILQKEKNRMEEKIRKTCTLLGIG